MSTSQFHASNRGAAYRAPTMRVHHARVVVAGSTESDNPSWLAPQRANFWQPLRLAWNTNGRLSTLTLKAQASLAPGAVRGQHVEDIDVADGDMVILDQVGSGGRSTRGADAEWFRGYVAGRRIEIDPEYEGLVVTAFGPEIRLRNKVVSGRWHKTADADDAEVQGNLSSTRAVVDNVFRSDLPVVFNEGGQPNASGSAWRLTDDPLVASNGACRVFEAPEREVIVDGSTRIEAEHWTAYTAVRSLVEFFDNYDVISPDTPWDAIETILGQAPIGEVRVEGRNLLEALRAILLPAGFGFALEPWSVGGGRDGSGPPRHRLLVFSLTNPATVRLPNLAPIAWGGVRVDSVQGRRAEVQRIRFLRDSHEVANDVTVIGDQKRVQVSLEFHNDASSRDLHPLWDTDAHSLDDWADEDIVDPWQWPVSSGYDFDLFSSRYNRGGRQHWQNRHVFRSFAWNEDGALASVISAMPDLSAYGLGGQGQYVRRPRPVASTFAHDGDGQAARFHPRKVQLGIVGDDSAWIDVSAEIWNDRAGLTLSVPLLASNSGEGQWYPYAPYSQHSAAYRSLHYLTLLHNALRNDGTYKLRLRLIGSIECDRAVTGAAARRVAGAWPFRAEKVLRMGGRFAWREVLDSAYSSSEPSSTVDDSNAAQLYAEQVRDASDSALARGHVVLRQLTRSYVPGDGIGATAGRVVDLSLDGSGGGQAPVILGVVWNFENDANKTRLLLSGPSA